MHRAGGRNGVRQDDTDSAVVRGVRAVHRQEGGVLHATASSGRHVGGAARLRGDGRGARPRGGLQYTIRGLLVGQDHLKVSDGTQISIWVFILYFFVKICDLN